MFSAKKFQTYFSLILGVVYTNLFSHLNLMLNTFKMLLFEIYRYIRIEKYACVCYWTTYDKWLCGVYIFSPKVRNTERNNYTKKKIGEAMFFLSLF